MSTTKRISEMTTLSAGLLSPAEDIVLVVDTSEEISSKNKKVTAQCLLLGAAGSDPLPFLHKEEFKPYDADVYYDDNIKSHNVPHIWKSPPYTGWKNIARIRCFGGGGAGGAGNTTHAGGGGGGACFVEKWFEYTNNTEYLIYAGLGGTQVKSSHGSGGEDSKVTHSNGSIIALSKAGLGGAPAVDVDNGSTGGFGGDSSKCVGDILKDGAAGDSKTESGIGGSGGGTFRGGRGGAGGTEINSGDAKDGNFPGAGGGGGSPYISPDVHKSQAGNGSHGLVTIEYNNDPSGTPTYLACGLVTTTTTTTSTSTTSTSTSTTSTSTTTTSTSTTSTSTTSTSTSTSTTSTSTTSTSTSTTSTSTTSTSTTSTSTSTSTTSTSTSTTSTSTTTTSTSTTSTSTTSTSTTSTSTSTTSTSTTSTSTTSTSTSTTSTSTTSTSTTTTSTSTTSTSTTSTSTSTSTTTTCVPDTCFQATRCDNSSTVWIRDQHVMMSFLAVGDLFGAFIPVGSSNRVCCTLASTTGSSACPDGETINGCAGIFMDCDDCINNIEFC